MGNILNKAFPISLKQEVKYIQKKLPLKLFSQNFSHPFQIFVDQENLFIPERIYFNEISKDVYESLSITQKTIADCIYTRHCDGFVREKYLTNLLERGHYDYWVTPFIIKLTGEHVIEILSRIQKQVDHLNDAFIKDFFLENPSFHYLITQRIISYWNCYYRWDYSKEIYVGFDLIKYYTDCIES
ncbi:hypothetical protein [Rummeliibacillus stabekisii]|uniref:hypothetical protein n=1 Tax=Rummeliibacillus stabekisii TaxID=241244 RepID=UPI00116C9662|nr:hypothetical protein [Rummeliibacillus stabekisii]MBB5169558.1 hypothetical protein [Rummeliibacillus stabekisii]GEL03816.1 hypothetical protein RST01_04430 [Rummeliibacillus stabekisii]